MAYSIIIITIIFTLHRIGIAAVFWKSWTGFTNIKFRWWSKLFCPRVSFSQLHLQDHKQNYQNQNLTWEHPSVTKSSSIPNDTGQVRRDSRKWDLFQKNDFKDHRNAGEYFWNSGSVLKSKSFDSSNILYLWTMFDQSSADKTMLVGSWKWTLKRISLHASYLMVLYWCYRSEKILMSVLPGIIIAHSYCYSSC